MAEEQASEDRTCSVCFDEEAKIYPKTIDGDKICEQCVEDYLKPLFEEALKHEAAYPVRWGPVEIQATDFAHVLTPQFLFQYRQKETEYKTLPAQRIYCRQSILDPSHPDAKALTPGNTLALTPELVDKAKQSEIPILECGAMVANRATMSGNRSVCYRCQGRTCNVCGEALAEALTDDAGLHLCAGASSASGNTALDDLIRGRDYQVCPNASCKNAIALKDGCNHMTCPIAGCQTGFCFVCGEAADHDDGHWDLGNSSGCPRWNRPDDPNAQFDDEDEEVDEDQQLPPLRVPGPGQRWTDMPRLTFEEWGAFEMRFSIQYRQARRAAEALVADGFLEEMYDKVPDICSHLEFMIQVQYSDCWAEGQLLFAIDRLLMFRKTRAGIPRRLAQLPVAEMRPLMPVFAQTLDFYRATSLHFQRHLVEHIAELSAQTEDVPMGDA